jgi:tRNA dimethylallyltransferase
LFENKLLIVIAGPTASGKTRLSVDIALHFSCEIISADSRQCYKELTIGTAKPDADEMNGITHHFINSHVVTEEFNAGIFAEQASKLINTLFEKTNIIVVTGGSGLYIDALLFGVDDLPPRNNTLRKELADKLKHSGIKYLQDQLKEKDPEYFNIVDINNPQRLIRALEIIAHSGLPYSTYLEKKEKKSPWNYLMCGINFSRDELYDRINNRVDQMFENGLVAEVKSLQPYRSLNALQTVGYKEVFSYLSGDISLPECVELVKKNTRNYAKRQLTWFRRYPEMQWVEQDAAGKIIEKVNSLVG